MLISIDNLALGFVDHQDRVGISAAEKRAAAAQGAGKGQQRDQ